MQLVTASPIQLLLLLLALAHNVVSDKPLIIENGAVCENKATGFFVVDNTILSTADSIVYKDTPEEDCLTTCSTNRDRFGRSILCASFVYDHASFTCTIFKEKAKPEGKADVIQSVGKRYFEKVCLGDDVPMECADSQFIRADDSVLIGFARNVTLVETMEQCVEQCVKESDCKSAMYFYEEGECITNTESALSKPSAFAKEENEKVVYFQNGCLTKLQTQESVTDAVEATTMSDSSETTDEIETAETESPTLTTTEPSDSTDESDGADMGQESDSGRVTAAATEEPEVSDSMETADDHETSEVEQPSHTAAENVSEDDDVEETTSAETTPAAIEVTTADLEPEMKVEDDDEDYVAEDDSEDTETATTVRQLEKKGEKASYIKYKKHPKNFASKIRTPEKEPEAETETTPADDVEEKAVAGSSSAEEEIGDSFAGEDDGEPVEGEMAPVEGKKHLSIKRVLENKEDGEEYPTYFSDWSDWTPCTKAGERQIRRRKCLDLRRCLGALMQVRNCPAVLPEPVQSGPIESVRSVIDVPRIPEYDDSDGQVDLRQPSSQHATENIWSPWLGVCQHFASGQPCNNGEMIGFESRECIAKEPSLCEGPFFRYCTLPC
uniref:Apple domain-containing protein n=1 Tax=Haemonchus contortus TaxID=6289 RepID=A0A7I4Z5R7_HAECO